EATRISCGPLRVPGTYEVVRASGTGRMTTRACSKSVVVGVVPPNSLEASRSYSNGRFINFVETIGGDSQPIDGHDARGQSEHGWLALGNQRRRRGRQRARQERQRDRRVGLHRDLRGVGRKLAPASRFLERRAGGAAE